MPGTIASHASMSAVATAARRHTAGERTFTRGVLGYTVPVTRVDYVHKGYHTTRGSPLYPLIVLYNVENYCG
jgi:hypothetical protein